MRKNTGEETMTMKVTGIKRFIAISDIHAHSFKQFDIRGSRLLNCISSLEDAFAQASENDVDTILFGGDLFDKQNAIPTVVINRVVEALIDLFDVYPDINIVAISGNHDQASKNLLKSPAETALKFLHKVFKERFNLIDNNCTHFGEVGVYGIPYYEFKEQFSTVLNHISKKALKDGAKERILLIHQTPDVGELSNIMAETHVNDPAYDAFDLVLIGHIHHPNTHGKFITMGNPLQQDLGDRGDEKGMWLVGSDGSYKFLSRDGKYPKFLVVPESELSEQDVVADYLVAESIEMDAKVSVEDVKKFDKSVTDPIDMVKNYFETTGEEDKDLLEVGLSFVK